MTTVKKKVQKGCNPLYLDDMFRVILMEMKFME